MTFQHVTLAMDLSLSQPGFAVLGITDEGKPILLEKSFVKTNAKHSHGRRLCDIEYEIKRLLIEYMPEHIVREKGFSRFPTVTQTLFKVVGISDKMAYLLADKEVHEIAVTSVKKLVTGNGKASKDEVERAVRETLQIEKPDYFANDDESDAVAVGIAYYRQKGLIEAGEAKK